METTSQITTAEIIAALSHMDEAQIAEVIAAARATLTEKTKAEIEQAKARIAMLEALGKQVGAAEKRAYVRKPAPVNADGTPAPARPRGRPRKVQPEAPANDAATPAAVAAE